MSDYRGGVERTPCVYVVDDDADTCRSVSALVSSMGLHARSYASGEDFLAEEHYARPGCLVTDLRMLGLSGIELQEVLIEKGIGLPVIMVTAHAETPLTVKAVKQGAVTVLEKPCRDYELVDAIRAAIQQDGQQHDERAGRQKLQEQLDTLSEQESAVLDMMIDGLPNKSIAATLDVSLRTIENRRQRIFEKTETKSLAELVRRVVELRSFDS